MGAEGAGSQGRCSLLCTTVLWGSDYRPSQNRDGELPPLLSLSALCRDLNIHLAAHMPLIKIHKNYSYY